MITIIIIDDELNAREYLKKLIIRHFPKKIAILEVCDSVESGVRAIKQHSPELVFLDIQMPGESGFELFTYFETLNFSVIFTTAYSDYTVDAIRHAAIDYLLKPINYIDLLSAIKRYEKRKRSLIKVEETAKSIRNICPEETSFNKIALPTQKGYILIQLNTIVYCQAESNYCKIFCNNKKEFLISKTLKYIEEILDNELFIRIHKSFLVNLNYVAGYDKTNDLKVTLLNGIQLPVSVRKKEQFLNAILKK